MQTKYGIITFTCIVSLVIIEKETYILSGVSDTLIQRQAPQPKLQTQQGLPSEGPEEEEEDMGTYNHSGGHRHILIFASYRTGSSFVGQLFNQHGDNMFYLFEPLWHVPDNVSTVFYADILQKLFQCDFSLLEKFIRPPPHNHVTSALFNRAASAALCEKPVCTPVVNNVRDQWPCATQSCGPLNLTLASESCLTKEYHAIKTARMFGLDQLRPLVEDPRLDVRVIQLVRDPRAMLASRIEAFSAISTVYQKWKTWAQGGQVHEDNVELKWLKGECDSVRMSAMLGLRRPRWLQRRYMLLRYEDLTRYPMQKAEEMYRFAGMPFSSQAREWILRNTQTTPADADVYSTQRNSLEQADKWRSSLPYELARVVQKVCGPTMELFGYSFVDDEKTLVNRSISLLDPLYLL